MVYRLLFLSLFLAACATPVPALRSPASDAPMRVMTFNIRYNTPSDGVHAWPNRADRVASMIRFHDADLVGLQEALKGQIDDLQQRLPGYRWFGVGRDDGREAGEYTAIFYRPDRFEKLDEGTFWLSESPQTPGSKSWDAAITRIATWGRFRDQTTGTAFYLFNTHFDHRGVRSREESARLLQEQITRIAGDAPVLVTGDFNLQPDSEAYRILTQTLRDTHHASESPHHGPEGTFSGFDVTNELGGRIDYILARNGVAVHRHGTLTDQWNGAYPSDHLPVLAEVSVGARR